jgi:hypothetical protein
LPQPGIKIRLFYPATVSYTLVLGDTWPKSQPVVLAFVLRLPISSVSGLSQEVSEHFKLGHIFFGLKFQTGNTKDKN